MEFIVNGMSYRTKHDYEKMFKRLQKEVRRNVAELRSCKRRSWKFLLPFLFKLRLFHSYLIWKTIQYILRLFDEYKCNDQYVIGSVLHFASIMLGNRPLYVDPEYADFYFVPDNCFLAANRRNFFHLMKIPYKQMHAYESIQHDVVFMLVKNGKVELLSAFLRHGIMCIPLQNRSSVYIEIISRIKARM